MANKFMTNIKTAFDKKAMNILWQGAIGSVVYLAVPTLLNKFVSGDKKMFDGILGIVTGLVATLVLYALTKWEGVLASLLIHPPAQVAWYAWYKYGSDSLGEPFNAFPDSGGRQTTQDYWVPSTYEPNYILPPKYENEILEKNYITTNETQNQNNMLALYN